MAEIFFPFDQGAGANVREADWSKMARFWRGSGVLPANINYRFGPFNGGVGSLVNDISNQLSVVAATGMNVTVKSGKAWIMGHYYENSSDLTVTLPMADPTYPRIDRVVVRVDWVANTVGVKLLQGTPSSSPTAPTLTMTEGGVWEIPLAQIYVGAAASSIVSANITDERIPSIASDMTPACEITAASSQTLTAGYNKISFSTKNYDNFSMADTANSQIKINVSGLYLVKFTCRLDNNGYITITKNATSGAPSNSNILGRLLSAEGTVTAIAALSRGNTIQGYVYPSGATATAAINPYVPTLSAVRIGDYAT